MNMLLIAPLLIGIFAIIVGIYFIIEGYKIHKLQVEYYKKKMGK